MQSLHLQIKYRIAFLLFIFITLIGCTNEIPQRPISNITLDKNVLELKEGEAATLTATVYPTDANKPEIIWLSSDNSIVSVNDGIVTAIKQGIATITVSTINGSVSDSCKVRVTKELLSPSIVLEKATATTAIFKGHLDIPYSETSSCKISFYFSDDDIFNIYEAQTILISEFDDNQEFTIHLKGLNFGTKYNYCIVTEIDSVKIYSDLNCFRTDDIKVDLIARDSVYIRIDYAHPIFDGYIHGLHKEDKDCFQIGVAYSEYKELGSNPYTRTELARYLEEDGSFKVACSYMNTNTKYYYSYYISYNNELIYGKPKELNIYHPYNYHPDLDLNSAHNLSLNGSANCYIISEPGLYKYKATKGNDTNPIDGIASCVIVWESFGTEKPPTCGDIIGGGVSFKDGFIIFKTSNIFKEGNAVIAVKDYDDKILWSWHIWFTDQPKEQRYYRSAGIMMDRNLGSLSATPGDSGTNGLLYQWGRKDPFLGYSSTISYTKSTSTIKWPSPIKSHDYPQGMIEYSIANPTTFIDSNKYNYDWDYTGNSSVNNTRWTTSECEKSIYDPCPVGWRVPDGGKSGVWSKAWGRSTGIYISSIFNKERSGINFSGKFGNDEVIWYPFTEAYEVDGNYDYPQTYYWSATTDGLLGCALYFDNIGNIHPSEGEHRSYGYPVRCIKE